MNYITNKIINFNGQDMMLAPLDIDFAHRTISLTGEIDEDVATVMNSALRCLARDSEDAITIYIQSPGGSVSAGFSIYDTIKALRCDVVTVACGMAASTLPNLMVASRSRNMRLMLVLQSNSQLVDVYGKSKAETINSCIGITIGFSTNSWETLIEWSQRCGEKQIENNGLIIKEQLITASQLAAMPAGTALVMVDSQYKFVVHLPFYDEMYDNSKWKAPQHKPIESRKTFKSFDFQAMVMGMIKKQIDSNFFDFSPELENPKISMSPCFLNKARSSGAIDIDDLVSRINDKISELEAEEE